jgi:type IV pilus assembly protein PilB
MPVRIGELLLKEKRITAEQLQQALAHQKANGGKLGFNLVKMGFVKDEEITALLSKQYGVPSINLTQFEIDPAVIKLIPADTAQKYQIIPLSRAGATLTIAMTDPTNVFAMDDIKFMTGYNVEPVVASETAVVEAIQRYYPAGAKAVASKGGAAGGGERARPRDPRPRGNADPRRRRRRGARRPRGDRRQHAGQAG